jgi:hypothetical protein
MSEESGKSGALALTAPARPDDPDTTDTTDVVEVFVPPDVIDATIVEEAEAPAHLARVAAAQSARQVIRPVEPPAEPRRRPPSSEKGGEPITVASIGRAWRALVEAVGDELDHRQRLWVLEAGAGTRTLFDLPEDAYVVGVDRDPWALERNARLDERVLADVANYRPLATGFDLINSWYVLDGLDDPAVVLERFAQWTGEHGLVVIAVQNLRSPRGLAGRLFGRVKLRRAVTQSALRRHFNRHGFSSVLQVSFEDAAQIEQRRRLRITRGRWTALQLITRIVSFGMLDAARTDFISVFRRDP